MLAKHVQDGIKKATVCVKDEGIKDTIIVMKRNKCAGQQLSILPVGVLFVSCDCFLETVYFTPAARLYLIFCCVRERHILNNGT